jgi:hypothetical protein
MGQWKWKIHCIPSSHQVFFHVTNQRSAQDIIENGINLSRGRANLDYGRIHSFYLNPSLDHAIDWISSNLHS